MLTRRVLLPALALLALLGLVPSPAHADEPVVRAVLFWAETCPHCHVVLNETLPPLQAQYGDRLEIRTVEVSGDPAGYELWQQAMETYQLPPDRRGIPMLVLGDAVLIGSIQIPAELPGLIESGLAAGGVDYPTGLAPATTPAPGATSTPPPTATPAGDGAVHMWRSEERRVGKEGRSLWSP